VWQQKRVAEYIEEHLAEEISLAALAELVDLSLYHFARVFKQSFGVPPHHYHMVRSDGDIVAGARPERLSHFTRECEAGDMVRASAFPINVKNRALSNPCEGVSIVE